MNAFVSRINDGLHAPNSPPGASGVSIGEYLIRRLQEYGVRDVFGIPGDYVLAFYAMLEKSPLRLIGCTREDCAGFAADAYARLNGIGAVCVTYCVGGLSLCNAVACAYAEKSPVVVVSGSPGMRERFNNPLLHHRVKDFHTQAEVFRKLCAAEAELNDPQTALREIDRVLDAVVRRRRPGYLELPRDLVNVVPEGIHIPFFKELQSDPETLAEAVAEAARRIAASQRPIIIAGVEIHRFGLQNKLLEFAEGAGIAIVATMLGKSVIGEEHPLFAGIYEGGLGVEEVTRFVEESDCVVLLGEFMTDINMGIFTANLPPAHCIYATSEVLRISHHHFQGVLLKDFLQGLVDANLKTPPRTMPPRADAAYKNFSLRPDEPITIRRLILRLNQSLDETVVIIADPGDALFASSELVIPRQTDFMSPAYYTSMGFAVPAALGAMVARPDLRPVVLVGDGAFQMTGMELSTIAMHGFSPIVIVLDNRGYGTERMLHRGDHRFNDVHPWAYHKLPEVLAAGRGYDIRTEGDFDRALEAAFADRSGFSLLHVHLAEDDFSNTLERMTKLLSRRVG
ncbi:MAG: alpha-keto acid decarboxylase family protein [Pirellulales bacterium]|nr:alpha-keto acid decarboxylase family protein [Pirellulales bacterium]